METHRIKAKIGEHEFDAEGDRELVSKQYDQFLATVNALSQLPKKDATQDDNTVNPPTNVNKSEETIPRDVLNRVFRTDEPLSLLAKPMTDNVDADGLIILIYGMRVLKGEQTVTGLALMKSAKQSGLKLKADRVDRTLASYVGELVNSAGKKRGLRYSLNNRGIAHAESLIPKMVQ